MLMVSADLSVVEADLGSGSLRCPCSGPVGPWGWARERLLRVAGGGGRRVRPRRGRCRGCGRTHVLLPVTMLFRRRDSAATIGEAIWLHVTDRFGYRQVAVRLAMPADTVRGWLRRFRCRSEMIRVCFTVLAYRLDPTIGSIEPAGSSTADAFAAIVAAVGVAMRRWGCRPVWEFVSVVTGAMLISNTNSLSSPLS